MRHAVLSDTVSAGNSLVAGNLQGINPLSDGYLGSFACSEPQKSGFFRLITYKKSREYYRKLQGDLTGLAGKSAPMAGNVQARALRRKPNILLGLINHPVRLFVGTGGDG